MAIVMKDATITVNGVNLSRYISSVSLDDTADEIDLTPMGGSSYGVTIQGRRNASVTATGLQDFGTGAIDQTLQPLYATGASFDVVVKATSAVTSTTNPSYTLTSQLFSYPPLAGAVGDPASVDLVFRNAGSAGLVRGTV